MKFNLTNQNNKLIKQREEAIKKHNEVISKHYNLLHCYKYMYFEHQELMTTIV